MKRRIIHSNNGTLSDFTVNMEKFQAGTETVSIVAAEDAIYIGSILPFNHVYVKLGATVNENASAMTVGYWDGTEFRGAVNLIDETSLAGATLGQSGHVTWVTDRDHGWIREDTNHGGNSVTGLTSVEIYDLYWVRLGFSADLSANIDLSWIGQIFSDDHDLGGEHAELVRSGFIAAFESGKTDWQEQHAIAADIIADDLIAKNMILSSDQILARENLRRASVKKVAQIIYTGMGRDYDDNRDNAKKEYDNRINNVCPKLDKNRNARVDVNEYGGSGRLYR
jgi:hypothetical protein